MTQGSPGRPTGSSFTFVSSASPMGPGLCNRWHACSGYLVALCLSWPALKRRGMSRTTMCQGVQQLIEGLSKQTYPFFEELVSDRWHRDADLRQHLHGIMGRFHIL